MRAREETRNIRRCLGEKARLNHRARPHARGWEQSPEWYHSGNQVGASRPQGVIVVKYPLDGINLVLWLAV